jgi:hypothetical protein
MRFAPAMMRKKKCWKCIYNRTENPSEQKGFSLLSKCVMIGMKIVQERAEIS